MSAKESRRKCFKCGKSPASDNIKLFRFPKPAVRNLLRCTLWAKYIFPAEEQYASVDFQKKLFSEHRMLCEHHFAEEDFTDASKKRLIYTAVPHDKELVSMILPDYVAQPGPSGIIPTKKQTVPSRRSPQPGSSRTMPEIKQNISLRNPLKDITNITISSGKNLKSEKEKHLYKKCAKYMKNIIQLRRRIKNLKNKLLLNELTEDNCIRKLGKKITPTFALILQSQIRNCQRKLTGRRWTKKDKIIALRLFKRSPTCYRLLRRLFTLPSPGTLKALLNRVPFEVGLIKQVIEVFKNYVKRLKHCDNEFILMFDEMSIKKHFNYNKKKDYIEGYQDHGSQGRSPIVAPYALVFMVADLNLIT